MSDNETYNMLHSYYPMMAVNSIITKEEEDKVENIPLEVKTKVDELNMSRKPFRTNDGTSYIT